MTCIDKSATFLITTLYVLSWAILSPMPALAGDGGFCARLKIQTEAAKVGFRTIRGEFRAGRTTAGNMVARTYSNVELWTETACFFGLDKGGLVHSCETIFEKDDAAARVLRDNLLGDLVTCFGKEVKGLPVISDNLVHTASMELTGKRAVMLTVNAQQSDGTDGRILISVRAPE